MKYPVIRAVAEQTYREVQVGEVEATSKQEAQVIVATAVIEGTLPKGSTVADLAKLPN